MVLDMFLAGYAPWMFFLFHAMKNVSSNWWVSDILKVSDALDMVFGGGGTAKITAPFFLFLCAVVLLADSGIVCLAETGRNSAAREKEGMPADFGKAEKDECLIVIHTPDRRRWTDKTYAVVIGLFTIAGTIVFGYFLCLVMTPVLVARYLYPVSAVTFCVLVVAAGRMLELLKKLGERAGLSYLQSIGKGAFVCILCILLVMGLDNYKIYSAEVRAEDERTQITLDIIGAPDEEVNMVTNGVKHLGWTVLYHYYPEQEIVNGDYRMAESDSFWYFNPTELGQETIEELEAGGMAVEVYGENWIAQYPFYLYYMEKK